MFPMISLAEAIAQKKLEMGHPKVRSERADLFNQLYAFYERDYKKQKWVDYVRWLKLNKRKHSKEAVAEYKKISHPKVTIKSFCSFWLCHIRTEDLYYLLSIARDKEQRGESFNRWLFWEIKVR